MSSQDRLWATLGIWTAVTIILTSFLVNVTVFSRSDAALILPIPWLVAGDITVHRTDWAVVVGLVSIVAILVVAATIATLAIWGQLRRPAAQRRSGAPE